MKLVLPCHKSTLDDDEDEDEDAGDGLEPHDSATVIPRKCIFVSTLSACSELLKGRFRSNFIFSHSPAEGKLEGPFVSPRVCTTNDGRISTNVLRKIEKDGDTPTSERTNERTSGGHALFTVTN